MACLRNKVVVVTGASSGIGRATAWKFSQKGANVVLAARRLERLTDLQRAIERSGGMARAVRCDVTVEYEVVRLFEETATAFGPVDILVNNAGRGLKAQIKDASTEEWNSVIHVNLTSVFLCTREAVRHMIASEQGGHVITVSSIAGKFGGPNYSVYCASKHGVTGFMKSAGWELREYGIRCNTIHPARIDTEFFDTYQQRPGRSQMITAGDFADFVVATAERNFLKKYGILWRNILKRIYNAIRFRNWK